MLKLSDYTYDLPQERVAIYPLGQRDESKLLVYRKGEIIHSQFKKITDFLPSNSFLFFNDTKVIPARLHFTKETGAEIEIFLLTPVQPSSLLVQAMTAKNLSVWECTVGNLKRWNEGLVLTKAIGSTVINAKLVDRAKGLIEFTWTGGFTFAEVITQSGETPLPPYLKRNAQPIDRDRYQTIYSNFEGAVAAPTAGLHFTDSVFTHLRDKGIRHDFVTLHVSAGTFQPVKDDDVQKHVMHHEQVIISQKNIENMLANDFIVPVGTTSMRTLESVYWYGVKLLGNESAAFTIDQDFPYREQQQISKAHALTKVLEHMRKKAISQLVGDTSIFIKPGYAFRVCNAMITNFHQPASTLILLVAAFVGADWKKIYKEALENQYRFLSYGDSSLLIP